MKQNQQSQGDENQELASGSLVSPRPAPVSIRIGDVFQFRYSHEESKRLGFSATHCFEGTLRARETNTGLMLVDTYWGIQGNGRAFTLDEAQSKGTLTFYFNFNDVEPVNDYEQVYYADEDVFTVSEQHACAPRCVHWFKRKGATRNADKMLRVIQERIEKRKGDIDSAVHDLDRLAQLDQQVREGDLEACL